LFFFRTGAGAGFQAHLRKAPVRTDSQAGNPQCYRPKRLTGSRIMSSAIYEEIKNPRPPRTSTEIPLLQRSQADRAWLSVVATANWLSHGKIARSVISLGLALVVAWAIHQVLVRPASEGTPAHGHAGAPARTVAVDGPTATAASKVLLPA